MKSIHRLPLLTLLLVSTAAVNASPKLATRQELWRDVDFGGLFQKTIDTGAGVLGGLGDWITSTWDQDRSSQQQENSVPNSQPTLGSPNNQPSQDPQINLEVIWDQDSKCTTSNGANKSCDRPTTDHIVYSASCTQIDQDIVATNEDQSRNQAITQQLTRINALNAERGASGPGLRISTSDTCDVVIWALYLNKEQATEVEKLAGCG